MSESFIGHKMSDGFLCIADSVDTTLAISLYSIQFYNRCGDQWIAWSINERMTSLTCVYMYIA